MGLSRQEVNLRRLLAKCELMLKSEQKDDERFPKYVHSLDEMFGEIKKLLEPSCDASLTYQRRINNIKLELGIQPDEFENILDKSREDLLGVRQRKPNFSTDSNEADQVINYHEDMQKKITNDMLILTRTLKEQSQLANQIIKKDTEVVGRSTQLTDKNHEKLQKESAKLAEHSRKAWKCWMWIMLLIVMVVFINMVLFMKVMKIKY